MHPDTIPQLLLASLRATEPDLRPNLFNNVVLTGGGSLLGGMGDRLSYELQTIAGGVRRILFHPEDPSTDACDAAKSATSCGWQLA